MNMPIRRGTHAELEAAADALIRESLKGVTRHSDKSDILTPWKETERRRREVYVPSGTPDPAVRQGLFHRSINPTSSHLNSRGGSVRGRRIADPHALSSFPVVEASPNFNPGVAWDSE